MCRTFPSHIGVFRRLFFGLSAADDGIALLCNWIIRAVDPLRMDKDSFLASVSINFVCVGKFSRLLKKFNIMPELCTVFKSNKSISLEIVS